MAAIEGVQIPLSRGALDTLDKQLVQDPAISLLVCELAPKLFDFIGESHSNTFNAHRSIPADSIFKNIKDPVEVFFANLLEARNKNDQPRIDKIVQEVHSSVRNIPSLAERARKILTLQKITEILNIPKKEPTLSPVVLLFQLYVAHKTRDKIWIDWFFETIKGRKLFTRAQVNEIPDQTYRLDAAKIRAIKENLLKPQAAKLPSKEDECGNGIQTMTISASSSTQVRPPIDITALKYIQETLVLDIPICIIVYQYMSEIFDYIREMKSHPTEPIQVRTIHPLFVHLPCPPETFIAQVLHARIEENEHAGSLLFTMLQNSFSATQVDPQVDYQSDMHEILGAFTTPPRKASSLPISLFQHHIALTVGDKVIENALFEYILLCLKDPKNQPLLMRYIDVLEQRRKFTQEELRALLEGL